MIPYFKKLNFLLDARTKRFFIILLGLSILFALVEAIGISAIMPFLSLVTNDKLIDENSIYRRIFEYFNFETHNDFIVAFGALLILFYILRGVFTFLFLLG